jgi:hypothetical protein
MASFKSMQRQYNKKHPETEIFYLRAEMCFWMALLAAYRVVAVEWHLNCPTLAAQRSAMTRWCRHTGRQTAATSRPLNMTVTTQPPADRWTWQSHRSHQPTAEHGGHAFERDLLSFMYGHIFAFVTWRNNSETDTKILTLKSISQKFWNRYCLVTTRRFMTYLGLRNVGHKFSFCRDN